jgi:hypothetical protein
MSMMNQTVNCDWIYISFPETVLEIPFTVPSGLVHSDQCSAGHLHFICLCVLCTAICGVIKDKQIGGVVEESGLWNATVDEIEWSGECDYIASTSPKEWNAPIIHVSENDDS